MNLEILIASLAFILSVISLYNQFFHKEIVVYPASKNFMLYLQVENSGGTLVQNFSIEVLNMEELLSAPNLDEEYRAKIKSRNSLNGKGLITLASKGKRRIPLMHLIDFKGEDPDIELKPLPIIYVKVRYKGLKRSKTFICDYNSYSGEMIDYDISADLKEINSTLKSGIRKLR